MTDFDIGRVLERYGTHVRSSAGYVKINCPWHTDETPSASVRNNRLHCFSCGWDGDAIDVIREREGCGYADAVSLAEEITGTSRNPVSGRAGSGETLFGSAGNYSGNGGRGPAWGGLFG